MDNFNDFSNYTSMDKTYAPCSYVNNGQWSYWNTLGDSWRVDSKQWPANARPSCEAKPQPVIEGYYGSMRNAYMPTGTVTPSNTPGANAAMIGFSVYNPNTPFAMNLQTLNPGSPNFSVIKENFTSVNKNRKYALFSELK